MKLNVNPNRMELMRLKKRLVLVRRGHKLLKDKQEELMRQFLALVRITRELRDEVEEILQRGYQAFVSARMDTPEYLMEHALNSVKKEGALEVSQIHIMNLRVPQFKFEWKQEEVHQINRDTPGDLDLALRTFSELIPKLLELAQKEKSIQLLSYELERTRRRVNALEYILMPNLTETIRFIEDKLTEMERSNITRLMKVKEIVQKEAY
ncbi:MAG: V-type ATP synthase subunit D [bacterium]|nr:MAG: V-type ATP synthase subunit D [bacterium]